MPDQVLRFQPLSSAVELSFWEELSAKKLNEWRLSSDAVPVWGSMGPPTRADMPGRVSLSRGAFAEGFAPPAGHVAVPGTLFLTNTMEEFKQFDKAGLMQRLGAELRAQLAAGDFSRLNSFALLVFADLKKHVFTYWFAFPALVPPQTATGVLAADSAGRVDVAAIKPAVAALAEPFFVVRGGDQVLPLGEMSQEEGDVLGFVDACPLPEHPGWPLRNLLFLAASRWGAGNVTALAYRELANAASTACPSLLLLATVAAPPADGEGLRTLGWEANAHGKLAPRRVNLSASMDPAKLAEASVDLNVRLMKWRLLPELDTELLAGTSCLLLGAGTLGCAVARTLLGWGVRKITLVDNGKVSYSNPVRQSLFTFEDCQQQRPKAQAAADALRRVFPAVDATGVEMTIPMPGHPLTSEAAIEDARAACARLTELMEAHDVVYLLLDTREARWLPTLLGVATDKIVLDVALGLDTFLVLRHGARGGQASGPKLGCYFCNDVIAPGDSTRDRTLDQQCTVTRPGLAPIAGALAVELMVGLRHHAHGHRAPADGAVPVNEAVEAALGLLPHSVRGYLTHFQNLVGLGHAFDRCSACSDRVLEAYESGGFGFLAQVFNDPAYLEQVTGLAEMQAGVEGLDLDWDSFSEPESEGEAESEGAVEESKA